MEERDRSGFQADEVVVCGAVAVINATHAVAHAQGKGGLPPLAVMELPPNLREQVRQYFKDQLECIPDGAMRVLELDRLERMVIAERCRHGHTTGGT